MAKRLAELGAAIIESDRLAHQELRDPAVAAQLSSWWGEAVLTEDGSVDRRAIADIVFQQPKELRRLEGLLYPRIARHRESLIATYRAEQAVKAIVLDSPKLVETGLNEQCDAVLFVETERRIRLERLSRSRGWSDEELARREKSLEPLDKAKRLADHTLVNHSGIAELRVEIDRIFSEIMAAYSMQ